MKSALITLSCVLSLPILLLQQATADILVNLDATTAPTGTLNPWNNTGTLGGTFTPVGAAAVTAIPKNDASGNVNAVTFSAATQYYTSSFNVPTQVTAQGARSIEVWAYNPAVNGAEEAMVSWSRRGGGPNNSHMSFNYGYDARWGALSHWGTTNDVGWGDGNNVNPGTNATAGLFPSIGQWHYLVYTYDGTATDKLYVDGVLVNQEVVGALATAATYNTGTATKFLLATQAEANGTVGTGNQGTLSLAKVKIRDNTLAAWEIRTNYNTDASTFGRATLPGPSVKTFSISPSQFTAGQQIVITYDVPGATALSINNGVGALTGTSGTKLITAPTNTTTFTLTATDGSGNNTATATAVIKDQIPILRHRYSFTPPSVGDTTTTAVPDSVSGLNGSVKGASFRWGEVSAAANNRAGQLVINPLAADNTTTGATATWIDLPNGLLTSRKGDFTLEGWVTCDGVQRWARVFDFGTNYFNEQSIFGPIVGGASSAGTDYLMLSAVNGTTGQQNVVEIRRTNVGNSATYAGAPAYGTQYHFAVVYDKDGNSGSPAVKFYRNGVFVGTIATTFNFEDFLDVNCWLGRSNFSGAANDLNMEGSFNEFRVYDGAYTDGDAAASFALGPDSVYDPGNIQAAIAKQPTNVTVAKNSPATFTFTPAGTPPLSIQWYRNGVAIPGATSASYTLPTATLVDDSSTFYVTVANNIGGTPYAATSNTVSLFVNGVGQALRHRYPFTGNFVDVISGANGTGLSANATVAPTPAATSVTLTAANQQYLDLPASGVGGINMNTYSQVTFESWASFPTNAGWARLFDFGNTNVGNTQGFNYILFTPHSGANDVRMSFTDSTGGATERILTYTPLLDNLGTFHIVTVFDPLNNRERMYLNGVLAAEGTYSGPTPGVLPALSNVGTQKAFIGRSLYADPFLNGTVDEFRIYNIALTSAEVAANYAAGPDAPPVAPTTIAFTQQPQNATINEPGTVTFTADIDGPKPLTAQWYKNNTLIPNATSLTYSYTPPPSDTGSTFFCRVGGIVGGNATTLDSNIVTLTVIPDTTAPTLTYAQNTNSTNILVTFSETVSSSANSAANYALSGGLTITTAVLSGDLKSVMLTTNTALTVGSTYTLTVNNIQDRATTPNTIAANSQRTFSVTPFSLTQFGTGLATGIIGTKPGGGYSLTAAGSGPSGTSDQFLLASQSKTGDFDLRVRVSELGLSDNWARAGIMARDGTLAEDSFAAAVATPGLAGCFLSSRFPAFSAATHTGSYPTNYPYTWLRLKRAGNVFTAYAGLDGAVWTPLGSSTLALSATLQVGLFASSASATINTTGCFFDYGDVVGGTIDNNPVLPFEPDGPSNRRSTMVISEINYNPNIINGTGDLEFVELHNTAPYPEDLSGWKFKGGITYTFPNNTIVKGGGYLVVARVPADVQTAYGITGVVGPWSGSLSNTGEEFRLENENGGTMCEVDYDDEAPWPIAAAGLGHSIVLARPSYGDSDPRAWAASNNLGGSPGRRDPYVADALRSVSINEFLANSEAPTEDFVELFNSSNSPIVVGGLVIGDGANLSTGYTIPNGTTIAARSYLSFSQTQLGFGLGSNGERLWLYSPNQRIIDALNYSGQDVNVSRNHDLKELATATPGAVNSGLKDSQVVINELMYNPITGNNADEYIELYNKGASAFSLSGWQIGGTVDFTFPVTASIPAGGYLVIAKDSVNLLTKGYAGLNSGNCLGNYTGTLPNGGGRVTLRKPFTYVPIGGGTATAYATVDEVTYSDGGRWGQWSDGGGSSLELRDARADNSIAANWGDSIETSKATYTNLTITALHDNRHPGANGVANRAEFFLQGPGECLVDDISIVNAATEYVINGGFESGIGAWVAQGDQKQASIQATGAATGTNCLKLIASDRGDAGANRVRSALTATLTDNLSFTLTAKVKWQRGSRFFNLRVRGNGLELPGVLNVPQNLGSPGTANSIAAANAGPAISDVSHFPVLPAAAQNVVVTARIADPDNVASATVQWRNDTDAGGTNTVAMKDDGTGGDAFSGDGIYSATIPGQATGKLIAFKVVATDAAGSSQSSTFPTPNPLIFPATLQARECLVRFGESAQYGTLGSYRLWATAATITEWTNREKNSNQPLDGTFVIGNYRAFYNIATLYSGSPWHAPNFGSPIAGNVCDYEVIFNPDDKFLGTNDFVVQAQDGGVFNDDTTCQAELTAFWMSRKLGLLTNHKRHVHMFINGIRRGVIYEDAQQPSGESIEEYSRSKPDGTLYKIEDWFEFDDAGAGQNNQNANLPATSTTINGVAGVKKMARYRWNWRVRGQADPNVYQPIYDLVDAVNAANTPTDTAFVAGVDALVDTRNWLRTILAHHLIGNWDSYGFERGKNGYAYKPIDGKWIQFTWDMDFAFGSKNARAATSDIFAADGNLANANGGQPETRKLLDTPAFRREYLCGALEAANGPLAAGVADPYVDSRYADFVSNGLAAASPSVMKTYMNARRNYILSIVPNPALALTSPTTVTTGTGTLTVTGTAPVGVKTIEINGLVYPIRWTSVTAWSIDVPLVSGNNTLNIVARDAYGNIIGSVGTVTANFTGTTVWAGLKINEWMAQNTSGIVDPADGNFEDWFEIYNPTANPVRLTGWYVSDSLTNALQYQIPAGYTIPANGFIRIWADGTPVQNAVGNLHTNFKLSNNGEALALSAPDGTLMDSLAFGAQVTNVSEGRYADGNAAIYTLTEPTPAASNILITYSSHVMNGGGLNINVNSIVGRKYRLWYSTDLVNWTALGADVTASTTTTNFIDPATPTNDRRYYRVELLPVGS